MSKTLFSINKKLNAPVEEAYFTLRTNIQFCGFEKRIKTLTVTSSNPGEGKTTTSVNIGIAMARSGLKVLLVDADMRTPMMQNYLGKSNIVGLTNFISGRSELMDIVESTEIKNLYFIGCGLKPPNPAEMLSSDKFACFLNEASEQFDLVVIDTPPLGSVIDAATIACHTDGTMLVVKARATDYHSVLRSKEQLLKANANILGVVLNKMKKADYRNYYSNYNYYGHIKKFPRIIKTSNQEEKAVI